jgi:hypothetical protein
MGYLKIKNKRDFVSNFLGPVSNLNDMCIINIEKDNVNCVIAAADSTIVCKASIEIENDLELDSVKLNVPDIKKLVRVLDIIPSETIELKINENSISYNKDGYRFKYHLLDDGIIKQPNISVDKVNNLDFDSTFIIKESNLNTIFKGSSFTTETSKLYLYSEEDKIVGELGDRNRHNTDNFVCVVSDAVEGSAITKPLALNFESFRLVSFSGSREAKFRVNQEMGVITCDLKKGNTALIYVISALIN